MRISKLSNYNGIDNNNLQRLEKYIGDVDSDVKNIVVCLNGRVRFGSGSDGARGENIAGEFQVVADTGSANTEFSVSHTIGSVPIGFLLINNDGPGVVYSSGTTWTSSTVYFKCSAANAAITIFLLK